MRTRGKHVFAHNR